jgi:hypothetical protein
MTAEKSPSATPGGASSTTPLPEALARHLGHDPVLQWLTRAGHPLTVENYVDLAWFGELPAELEPEEQELLDALAEYEASQRRRWRNTGFWANWVTQCGNEVSIDTAFKLIEIASILGGGGLVAFRLGRNSQVVREAMRQQAAEIAMLKDEIKELSKLVTEVAVQSKRLDILERRYDELRHGEGFVFPLSAQLQSLPRTATWSPSKPSHNPNRWHMRRALCVAAAALAFLLPASAEARGAGYARVKCVGLSCAIVAEPGPPLAPAIRCRGWSPDLAFFCYVYRDVPGHPCIRGEWLPATTIIMPGTYDSEDTRLNGPRRSIGHRVRPWGRGSLLGPFIAALADRRAQPTRTAASRAPSGAEQQPAMYLNLPRYTRMIALSVGAGDKWLGRAQL